MAKIKKMTKKEEINKCKELKVDFDTAFNQQKELELKINKINPNKVALISDVKKVVDLELQLNDLDREITNKFAEYKDMNCNKILNEEKEEKKK